MLQPTELAPLDIPVTDEQGTATSLRSLLGKWVVLYFYPKDDTPGCTVEACSFRDTSAELTKLGAVVIGVSKDTTKSHQNFKTKYQLNFPLWSDPDHHLLSAFGAWGEKKFMGKIYMGIIRSTFIIDPTGHIRHTIEKATPKHHGEEIMKHLIKLIKTPNQ